MPAKPFAVTTHSSGNTKNCDVVNAAAKRPQPSIHTELSTSTNRLTQVKLAAYVSLMCLTRMKACGLAHV